MPSITSAHLATEHFFRHEHGRLVATLVAQFGTWRLQLVEDAVQESLVRALQTWPYRGVPDNAAAWLTQAARNVMLDQLRREQRWQEREEGIAAEQDRWSGNADGGMNRGMGNWQSLPPARNQNTTTELTEIL